jgi:hypothetical protein
VAVVSRQLYIFYRNGNANRHLQTSLFILQGIRSAVKRVEFISDMMLYTILRGFRCDYSSECTCINWR